jgi:hypothetical protein
MAPDNIFKQFGIKDSLDLRQKLSHMPLTDFGKYTFSPFPTDPPS